MNRSNELRKVFDTFAAFGNRRSVKRTGREVPALEMDATKLRKLALDCGQIDSRLSKNQVDLIFQKVKKPGMRKITFDEFVQCTFLWAEKKKISHSELVDRLLSRAEGPKLNSTTAPDAVALFDDKSSYTGVYKRGGPAVITKSTTVELHNLLDRSPADVRGRKIEKPNVKNTKNTGLAEISNSNSIVVESKSSIEENYTSKFQGDGQEQIIHPDWYCVENPQSTSSHDRVYYVNRITNDTSWSRPIVNAVPPPPPSKPLLKKERSDKDIVRSLGRRRASFHS